MPTDSACASVIDDSYIRLKEDVLGFMQKGRVVVLRDLNRGWVDLLMLMM